MSLVHLSPPFLVPLRINSPSKCAAYTNYRATHFNASNALSLWAKKNQKTMLCVILPSLFQTFNQKPLFFVRVFLFGSLTPKRN